MNLSNATWVGQGLLWLGFVGGALASVYRLENPESPWLTIPWLPYLTCAVVGSLGVVLLREEKAAIRLKSAASSADLESVASSLENVAKQVAAFESNIDQKTCEQVLEFIDERCSPLLADFADGRSVISHRFGASTYAAVMTEFASGERYLNRAWSAAADGYVDEVTQSIQHACQFLTTAVQIIQAAQTEQTETPDKPEPMRH